MTTIDEGNPMTSTVSFVLGGRLQSVDLNGAPESSPTTTVLNYLRALPTHKGVKEGCAEGDCGACTVVLGELDTHGNLRYKAVDSCLVFLPMLHRKQLVTVENLASNGELHAVQQAMVDTDGSQCGFCTPGFIMSLFTLYKNYDHPTRGEINDALTGNLCRCTGYRPIVEAASRSCVHKGIDHFSNGEQDVTRMLQSISVSTLNIRTARQEYHQPATLAEALEWKSTHKDTVVTNGATDIALRVTKKHELLKSILDLSAIRELQACSETNQEIVLGSGMNLNDVFDSVKKDFPALSDMLSVFGSRQIRNLATLGGNLGTASPISDTIPVLMAYNASIRLQSTGGTRDVPLNDFIKGYRETDRKPDELITAVVIPKLSAGIIVRSYKISKRKDLDISTLSGVFRLQLNSRNNVVESIRLCYGGMAAMVKRARSLEQSLIGKKWERSTVEQVMPLIEKEFTPIADARGGIEFRKAAAANLLLKFWSETNPK